MHIGLQWTPLNYGKITDTTFEVYWTILLLIKWGFAVLLLHSENLLKPYVLIVCGPLTFPVFLPGRRSRGAPSSLPLSVSLSPASPCWLRDSVSDWTCDGVSEFWFSGDEEREGESRKRFMAGWLRTDGSLLVAWKQMKSVINCLGLKELSTKQQQNCVFIYVEWEKIRMRILFFHIKSARVFVHFFVALVPAVFSHNLKLIGI